MKRFVDLGGCNLERSLFTSAFLKTNHFDSCVKQEMEKKNGNWGDQLRRYCNGSREKDGVLEQVVAVRWKAIHKVELTGLGKLTESGRWGKMKC